MKVLKADFLIVGQRNGRVPSGSEPFVNPRDIGSILIKDDSQHLHAIAPTC